MSGLVSKNGKKPRLNTVDDMFSLSGTETQTTDKNAIISVKIESLTPFKNHPFHLYEGERLEDMTASIKTNGVLVPVIVRRIGETLEILAGHNRVEAAKLAGLDAVPSIILDGVSDEDAMVYVVETNLLQRSFSEMTHTEKAAVITLHHSKMFSQGKRNDILEKLQIFNKPQEYNDATCSQVANKRKTITKVGQEYGLSKDTVARYLRIGKLIPALQARLDKNDFAFIPAVTLSYLKPEEQEMLNGCLERGGLTVDMKKAETLRKLSESGNLNSESMNRALNGEAAPVTHRSQTVKLSSAVYEKYFKPNQSAEEIQSVVEKALELYFAQSNE